MAREYKDSGIEWIGQIPKEWEIATLKQIGTYINGYAFKLEDWTDSGKPIIRIQDLTGSMGCPNCKRMKSSDSLWLDKNY